jgi:hypothetical protein
MNLSEKIEILESEKIKSRILMQGGFCCMIPLGTLILSFIIDKNYFGKSFTIIGLVFGFLFAYGGYIMLLMSSADSLSIDSNLSNNFCSVEI